MPWLNYSEDEVTAFHPEFQAAADVALRNAGLDGELEWQHHVRTSGSSIVPDFVLRYRVSRQWLLALELKRRREAVFSTRNQIQAKGYAENNQGLYRPTYPRYFAISNLEITILGALNGDRPARECQLLGGLFESGSFETVPTDVHRNQFIADITRIVEIVTTEQRPQFDIVWPAIIDDLIAFSEVTPPSPQINLPEPNTANWPAVRDFFSAALSIDSARIFFLRCLMAEYLRGALIKSGHVQAQQIPGIQADPRAIANTVAALRQIDFHGLFEDFSPELYRSTQDDDALQDLLLRYALSIIAPDRRVVDLSRDRVDSPALLDSLMTTLYPVEIQEQVGKVQTDPELASILARLTILDPVRTVLDPCCGDGILLSAAYDYLSELGGQGFDTSGAIAGIEADAIATRLTEARIALKQPATLVPQPPLNIVRGDMFANPQLVARAEAIVMNPPFLRYEEQRGRRVPDAVRTHYNTAIRELDGRGAVTTGGQANLYNYYVEFAIRAASVGTRFGIILDNKWYHNNYGRKLRELLLSSCHIEAIVEYPHSSFFASWSIATSVLVITKVANVNPGHEVKFVRSKTDPRSVDLRLLVRAFRSEGDWPIDWTCETRPQAGLRARDGWKQLFSSDLTNDYRLAAWPILDNLFGSSRRGSLEKEGGGTEIFEFPIDRSDYGPRRMQHGGRVGFQTLRGRALTPDENDRLRDLASEIPPEFRGRALRNSDDPSNYVLTPADVEKESTLEPPMLRTRYDMYQDGRTPWADVQEQALVSMRANPHVAAFIAEAENVVNLTEAILPREMLWIVLREPVAGELIIPRKTRTGHWVHINRAAFDLNERQVRISSNFLTYRDCLAIDAATGLTREISTHLIAAFLVSSFGNLQFEMEGYNREGCLSVEKHHFSRIRIFDPRWIRPENRDRILDTFSRLPYPISTDRYSAEQTERNRLDELFAEEISTRFPEFQVTELLAEVHASLDEWLMARQP